MNIVINCPNCSQEMIVDDSNIGASGSCPTCNTEFKIPEGRPEEDVKKERQETQPVSTGAHIPKDTKPDPKKEGESKASISRKQDLANLLPGVSKGSSGKATDDKPGVRVKTFQHHLCIDMGKDLFPKLVGEALSAIDKEDLINISPLSYSYKDSQGEIIAEFGVMIIYNHNPKKAG